MPAWPELVVTIGTEPAQAADQTAGAASPTGRTRSIPGWSRPSVWLPPLIALGVLAGGWQLYAIHNPFVIPRLPEIFDDLGSRPDLYLRNALTTLEEALVGAAFGMGVGVSRRGGDVIRQAGGARTFTSGCGPERHARHRGCSRPRRRIRIRGDTQIHHQFRARVLSVSYQLADGPAFG